MRRLLDFVRNDFRSHPLRLIAETLAMSFNISVSILLLITTPHPPMIPAYIGWLSATSLLLGCSIHRGSFGLTTMYIVYIGLDGTGLLRTILS